MRLDTPEYVIDDVRRLSQSLLFAVSTCNKRQARQFKFSHLEKGLLKFRNLHLLPGLSGHIASLLLAKNKITATYNFIQSPGCGNKPQKNVSPLYADSNEYFWYVFNEVVISAGGLSE